MSDPAGPIPSGIDPTKPSIARVYDASLNGKDNFEVDRQVRDQFVEMLPEGQIMSRDNREWLIRVVRYLAGTVGIDQFLDLGSGLPTAENTHQAAQRLNPDTRVVYVDNDPVVLAHGRALLEENENTHFIAADVQDPDRVLDRIVEQNQLDLSRPVGLLMVAILHHVGDDEHPYELVSRYLDRLAPGSYVAISHFHNPNDGGEVAEIAEKAERILLGGDLGSGRFRDHAEIERFFDDVELIDPGVVVLADWWPDGPQPKPHIVPRRMMLGGLGRKR